MSTSGRSGGISSNCFGYGVYIDNKTHHEMPIFIENSCCLIVLINKVYKFFVSLFFQKKEPSIVRFAFDSYVFHVERETLLKYVQKELNLTGVTNWIPSKLTSCVESYLVPAASEKVQDFETFLASVKRSVSVGHVAQNVVSTGLGMARDAAVAAAAAAVPSMRALLGF